MNAACFNLHAPCSSYRLRISAGYSNSPNCRDSRPVFAQPAVSGDDALFAVQATSPYSRQLIGRSHLRRSSPVFHVTVFTLGDNAYRFGTSSSSATTRPHGVHSQPHASIAGQPRLLRPSGSRLFPRILRLAGWAYGSSSYSQLRREGVARDLLNSHHVDNEGPTAMAGERSAPHVETCIVAYWHNPLFSSGGIRSFGDPGRRTDRFWLVLMRHGADVVLNGHDHDYERFDHRMRLVFRSPTVCANLSSAPAAHSCVRSGR